ncbi:MAG: hypothetical protein COA79_21325 [Planctomycetota bacterium]|nr:MAG: hypothetical protein COA79_21325 [Planctomycetota bacterium]
MKFHILLFSIIFCFNFNLKSKEKINKPEMVKTVLVEYQLQNTSMKILKDVKFYCYAPIENVGFKTLNIKSNLKFNQNKSKAGNHILEFNIPFMAPKDLMSIKIFLTIDSSKKDASSEIVNQFKSSERFIESDTKIIRKLVKSTKDSKKLYELVIRKLKQGPTDPIDRGAVYALIKKNVDCTEFSFLYTALCRAANIPARVRGGYYDLSGLNVGNATYHNWVEIYQNNAWHVVDCQLQKFKPSKSKYLGFEIYENRSKPLAGFHRFLVSHKNNIKVKIK